VNRIRSIALASLAALAGAGGFEGPSTGPPPATAAPHGPATELLAALRALLDPGFAQPFWPKRLLSDSFDGSALGPGWHVLHPDRVAIAVAGGALQLEPTQAGIDRVWFHDFEGPLVYRWVTGDFAVRARVRVVATHPLTNPPTPPPPDFRLAGLLVRDPGSEPGERDWTHVAIGGAVAGLPVAIEDKHTSGSLSDFALYPVEAAEAELRLVRSGTTIKLYARPLAGGPWQLLREHEHPALPATVQVGAMVYSFSAPPRIRASFDELVFE